MRLRNRQTTGGRMATKIVTLVAALATTAGLATAVGTGTASAWDVGPNQTACIWGSGGNVGIGNNIGTGGCAPGDVRVNAWTRPGNTKTVVLLDGLRAQNDFNGWQINTNVGSWLRDRGVNVVEPVGGYESWYSDWNAPDNFSGQQKPYRWYSTITGSLVDWMRKNTPTTTTGKYGIMGLSMGGNSALVIASKRPDIYDRAGSLSGYLNLSAPGMREAIRMSMIFPLIDGGTPAMNSDAMWGPPWDWRWTDNDPFVRINNMRALKKVYVSSGSGALRGDDNFLANPMLLIQGTPLELLAQAQGRAFQVQALINGVSLNTYFPLTGVHNWNNWQDSIQHAYYTGFFN